MLAAPMPKRLETTFTSSGCETKYAIRLTLFALRPSPFARFANTTFLRKANGESLLLLFANPLNQLVNLFRRQVLVVIVVHLHGRSPRAGTDTLHFFHMK